MDDPRLWFSMACVLLAYAGGRRRALTPREIAAALDRPLPTGFRAEGGKNCATLELGDGLVLVLTASGPVAQRIARTVLDLPHAEAGSGAQENGSAT